MRIKEMLKRLDEEKLPGLFGNEEVVSSQTPPWVLEAAEIEEFPHEKDDEGVKQFQPANLDIDPEGWELDEWKEFQQEQDKWGVEALAWYSPFHLRPQYRWGIYIRETGILRLVSFFHSHSEERCPPSLWAQFSFELLHSHELFHFLTECAATYMELLGRRPLYVSYLAERQSRKIGELAAGMSETLPTDAEDYSSDCNRLKSWIASQLEEALANAYALRRTANRERTGLAYLFMKGLPRGYSDFDDYATPAAFARGKRLLGCVLNRETHPLTFWEVLFWVDPDACIQEVPTFVVRDLGRPRGSILIQRRAYGVKVAAYPGDHRPPHIHVRIPPDSRVERKYEYPSLSPMKGSPPLSGDERKKLKRILESDDFKRKMERLPPFRKADESGWNGSVI